MVPSIADYELRREYIRFNSGVSIAELDRLIGIFGYIGITDAPCEKQRVLVDANETTEEICIVCINLTAT